MKNSNCKHKMEKAKGVPWGDYPEQPVYICPNGGCAQWGIEFYAKPTDDMLRVILKLLARP